MACTRAWERTASHAAALTEDGAIVAAASGHADDDLAVIYTTG